ncbi:molybdenum cofactor guanylyltransferase MobA [Donghicola eburneus]|uniref:Molybdenum cofactor guanylyltransferase n=1 Tax=Donghicola eburneus TaxID=393278 RepID=A0A1M4MXU9_9RHOB|nr:molybdenum cofactor guanylyltransferase MobA [Donghicola eburneus]SCM67412.1 molybdopterin-guanine dinucleotide biosynthesis protein A [Donghicola eburneus]SFQ03882.1 molybdenum cofactor guanylyltransferase [Donghicola eburneus]
MTKPPAVILAGGKATRMGGGDKGLRTIGGKPLLDHVLDRMRPQSGPIALNANGDPARFTDYDLPVLPDTLPDHPGPLAGVLAGLDWAAANGHEAIVTAAADTPFFPADLVDRLQQAAGPSGLALAATREGEKIWRQPTFGLWPVALRDDLRDDLQNGLRKIVMWTDQHDAGLAIFDTDPVDPFFNVNTPDDITEAERLLEAL